MICVEIFKKSRKEVFALLQVRNQQSMSQRKLPYMSRAIYKGAVSNTALMLNDMQLFFCKEQ